MPEPEINTKYEGVRLVVSQSDQPGYYQFRYQNGNRTFKGKIETKLAWMAVRELDASSNAS